MMQGAAKIVCFIASLSAFFDGKIDRAIYLILLILLLELWSAKK